MLTSQKAEDECHEVDELDALHAAVVRLYKEESDGSLEAPEDEATGSPNGYKLSGKYLKSLAWIKD